MSVTVVIFLFLIHIIEILWYALMLYFAFDIVGLNGFQGDTVLLPLDFLHVAASSFTTLGSLSVTPQQELALLIDAISLTGFMMLTWSATYYYNIFSNSNLRDTY
tara:strand:- start:824 stop:1138 length:315 start_codon:yes stop_codon:yes gene_type:complete